MSRADLFPSRRNVQGRSLSLQTQCLGQISVPPDVMSGADLCPSRRNVQGRSLSLQTQCPGQISVRPDAKFQSNPFSSFEEHASQLSNRQTDRQTEGKLNMASLLAVEEIKAAFEESMNHTTIAS